MKPSDLIEHRGSILHGRWRNNYAPGELFSALKLG